MSNHFDLKDAIFGKSVVDLTDEEACRAAELIGERRLSVYCLLLELETLCKPYRPGSRLLGRSATG